ncbi:hypothetical protein BH10BAC2_BH10BAC2_46450 [soil metagenome]
MKTLLLFAVIISTGCNGILENDDSIQSFIPGTYSSHLKGEYSIADDTLAISKVNDLGNTYAILRHISFQRIIENKIQSLEYKREKWIAIYDEKDKVLYEQKDGKIISFAPEKNMLLLGSSEYKKVNE